MTALFLPRGVERRALLWPFFALTFAWSWTCWFLAPAVKPHSPSLATVLMFAGSFGPSLAALLVVANAGGRAGLRAWFGRCLRWRIGWRWLAFALLLPAALTALAAGSHIAMGGTIGPSRAVGRGLMTVAIVPVLPTGEGYRPCALLVAMLVFSHPAPPQATPVPP
jgi:hypothetical protein